MKLAPLPAGLLVLFGADTTFGAAPVQAAGDCLAVGLKYVSLHDILQAAASAGHFALHFDTSLSDRITVQLDQRL